MELNITFKADSGEVQSGCSTINNFVNTMGRNDYKSEVTAQEQNHAQNIGNVIAAIKELAQPIMPAIKGIAEKYAGLIPLNGKNFVEQKDLAHLVADVLIKAFPYLMREWEKVKDEVEDAESEGKPEGETKEESQQSK